MALLTPSAVLADTPPAEASAPIEAPSTEPAPPSVEPNMGEYAQLVAQAVDEFGASHFIEARALFERAHAIYPNARTLRGLGITAFELRRYTQAVRELRAALDDTRNALPPALRDEVTRALTRANEFVGLVALEVQPHHAKVLLDGAQVAERELALDVGDYTLVVTAAGYRAATIKITVTGGKKQAVSLQLFAAPADAGTDGAPTLTLTSHDHAPALHERWWFWAGAVAIVGGTITAVLLLSQDSEPSTKPGDVGGVVQVLGAHR